MKPYRRPVEREELIASCFALLPALLVLLERGSALAIAYLGALATSIAYHRSDEERWSKLDHAFAYSVIGSNLYMARETPIGYVLAGSSAIASGLACYVLAHLVTYPRFHALWHAFAGLGGFILAIGYEPK